MGLAFKIGDQQIIFELCDNKKIILIVIEGCSVETKIFCARLLYKIL